MDDRLPDVLHKESDMARHSGHGIAKDDKAQEQPVDKKRAQTAHRSDPRKSATREATRDPKLTDAEKTPGSGISRRRRWRAIGLSLDWWLAAPCRNHRRENLLPKLIVCLEEIKWRWMRRKSATLSAATK